MFLINDSYAYLVVLAGVCTYFWRAAGVAVAAKISTESALFSWISCVAFAMLAGLISRVIFLPTGSLEATALWERLASAGVALIVYFFLTRKNLLMGVISSGATLYALRLLNLT